MGGQGNRSRACGSRVLLVAASLAILLSPAVAPADAAPARFSFTTMDLGTLPGTTDSRALAISDLGRVVGVSGGLPFVWSVDRGMDALPILEGWTFTTPYDINGGGLIVGETRILGLGQAVLWIPDEAGYVAATLPIPSGVDEGFAFGLNDAATVVGCMRGPLVPQAAVVWTPSVTGYAVPASLPGLPETSSDCATSINEAGGIAGWSGPVLPGPYHAVLWMPEAGFYSVRDLGVLRGGFWSQAWDINDRGTVVGDSGASGDTIHGFSWSHRMRDLGTLGGFTSTARAVDNRGFAVGSSWTDQGTVHAYLVARGAKVDLGTRPGGLSSFANDINEGGVIAGASDGDGSFAFHATLWVPLSLPG